MSDSGGKIDELSRCVAVGVAPSALQPGAEGAALSLEPAGMRFSPKPADV